MNIDINGVSITLTQEQLNEIAKQTKPAFEPFWEPINGRTAWGIGAYGEVFSYSSWPSREIAIGTYYRTEAEAIKARDIQRARQRLKKAIYNLNEGHYGWEYDRTDCSVYLSGKTSLAITGNANKFYPSWMYLRSRELCEELIESHRDDLLLVLGE